VFTRDLDRFMFLSDDSLFIIYKLRHYLGFREGTV